MKTDEIRFLPWIVVCITGFTLLFAATVMADNNHGYRSHFERVGRHDIPFLKYEDDGNETAGQLASWLLLLSNFPVALSLLIKGTNRFTCIRDEIKNSLTNVNRSQKKALMWLHYYLNTVVLGIAIWHWLSSRCKSTAMPELGLMMMATVVVFGIFIKFKLSPNIIRKYVYKIHTQPAIFLAMFLVLMVGHLIMD